MNQLPLTARIDALVSEWMTTNKTLDTMTPAQLRAHCQRGHIVFTGAALDAIANGRNVACCYYIAAAQTLYEVIRKR